MATEYVNPDFTGTSDGSITNPWKSGADATLANDLTLLWKRGSSPDVLSEDINSTHTNVKFGAYGDINDPLPIISCYYTSTDDGDWTETSPGSELWEYTDTSGVFNTLFLLALGELPSNPRDPFSWCQRFNHYQDVHTGGQTTPNTYGQWDSSFANPSILVIYSDINPVEKWGTIYIFGQNTQEGIRVTGDTITCEDINFRFCARGFNSRANAVDITVQDCVFEFCYDAIAFGGTNGMNVLRNDIYASARRGIAPSDDTDSTKSSYIEDNTITNTGYGEGVGGIYGDAEFPAAFPLKVYNNVFDKVHKGIYWTGEGFPLYAESTSKYWDIIGNTVINQRDTADDIAAFHSNGGVGIRWISNKSYNCGTGINISDALPIKDVQEEVLFNTFHEVDVAFAFSRKPNEGGEVFRIEMYGNVATADPNATGTTYMIVTDNDVDDINTLNNDANWLYGFDQEVLRTGGGGTNTTIGSNTVTDVDPLLDSNANFAGNSPVFNSSSASLYPDSSVVSYDAYVDANLGVKRPPYDVGAHPPTDADGNYVTRYKSPIGLRAR